MFKRSELTTRLVNYLRAYPKGTQLTYDELSKAMDARITRLSLWTPRRILEREHSQVWIPVAPKIGIIRLRDPEIANRLPTFHLRGAGRKLNRGHKQSGTVDIKTLSVDEQSRFSVACIQREIASQALDRQTRARLEKLARGTSNDLPSFNIVEWAINLMPGAKPR